MTTCGSFSVCCVHGVHWCLHVGACGAFRVHRCLCEVVYFLLENKLSIVMAGMHERGGAAGACALVVNYAFQIAKR